jgi:AraC family transcriptional regulator of adaptative response/methylated-DNA-[protein]-cysteine methyltransferase
MTQHSLSLPTLALATPTLPNPELADPETCWQAVLRRDRTYNGRFWFSVRTTGVYCLPSCAARQPLRRNVAFHASPAAAEAAGFRPCKRCKPRWLMWRATSACRAAH